MTWRGNPAWTDAWSVQGRMYSMWPLACNAQTGECTACGLWPATHRQENVQHADDLRRCPARGAGGRVHTRCTQNREKAYSCMGAGGGCRPWLGVGVDRRIPARFKFGSRTTRFPRVSPVRLAVRGGPIENEYESRTGERGAVRSD